jgi:hypothetical protein
MPVAKKTKTTTVNNYIICEEWEVRYRNGEIIKLLMKRDNVKLQPHVLQELNAAASPANPFMYYEKA